MLKCMKNIYGPDSVNRFESVDLEKILNKNDVFK